jgi:NTE family protein
LANIGVLRAWQEAGLPLDMIAASGISAVVAGLYASGMSADELADVATRRGRDLDPFDGSLSLRLVSRSALYSGKRARSALRKLLDNRTFADLRVELYVLASEQINGEPVILEKGSLLDAMEASLAIAGLVAPAEIDERRLVDGGLVSPLPANILVNRGAGVIVGVSAIPHPATIEIEAKADLTYTWLRLRDQMAYAALMNNLRDLDLLVAPDVREFSALDFERAADLIAIGEAAARREIEHIKSLIMPEQSE